MHAEGVAKPSQRLTCSKNDSSPLLIPVEAKVGDSFDVPAHPLGSPGSGSADT